MPPPPNVDGDDDAEQDEVLNAEQLRLIAWKLKLYYNSNGSLESLSIAVYR